MTWEVRHGDCLDGMRGLDADSVDAIVTDPPYGLSFMGKAWDHGVPGEPFWAEALRVAKPGAHLLAFGGTRTFHRLACAIEDAGWEIRDCLSWLYGSGFPKSLDIAKALDKKDGRSGTKTPNSGGYKGGTSFGAGPASWRTSDYTPAAHTPSSDLAKQWQGWGTALKPGWEPIIMARKPLVGTVAANVAAHGTGGLNVDGCRIGTADDVPSVSAVRRSDYPQSHTGNGPGWGRSRGGLAGDRVEWAPTGGRWPANVCLDEDAAAALDEQSGERKSAPQGKGAAWDAYGGEFGFRAHAPSANYGDTGGASRFFYCAKASRSEREAGLTALPVRRSGSEQFDSRWKEGTGDDRMPMTRNHHPTVKPLALMRWLCRLVTPPGGLVLDPFTGSGTTGCAAVLEGFRFLGFEREAEYVEIARKRIAHHVPEQPELIA